MKDECGDFSHCQYHSTCVNTIGNFEIHALCNCKECLQRNGNKCENINECEEPTSKNPCLSKQHSTCRDIDGSFGSKCDPGYEGDPMNGEGRLVPTVMQVEEENTNECPENSKCQGN